MKFDLTRILAPNAVKPRTSGPRDSIPQRQTAQVEAAPATPAAAPTTTNRINLLEPDMHPNDTQGKVLAALTLKSPMTAAELREATGLEATPLSNAIYNLKKKNAVSGHREEYKLADGQAASAPSPKAKSAKSAATKLPAKIPCGPGAASFADRIAAIDSPKVVREHNLQTLRDHMPAAPRAILTADGGCIVLDGVFVAAELTKAQRDAVVTAA